MFGNTDPSQLGLAVVIILVLLGTIFKFLTPIIKGAMSGESKPSNGFQTNKQVNITVTDRLKQFEEGVCNTKHQAISKRVEDVKTELKEDIRQSEEHTLKIVETVTNGMKENTETQINFMKTRFDDVLAAINKKT